MSDFARPFRLHTTEGHVLQGAEFPSGRVVVDRLDEGDTYYDFTIALDVGSLLVERFAHARVEWADQPETGGNS
jgi:hypothetical protein